MSRLHQLLEERLGELKLRKQEAVLKATECTEARYLEVEHKRYKLLAHYTMQELEDVLLASSKAQGQEFLKHFNDFKGRLLTPMNDALRKRQPNPGATRTVLAFGIA